MIHVFGKIKTVLVLTYATPLLVLFWFTDDWGLLCGRLRTAYTQSRSRDCHVPLRRGMSGEIQGIAMQAGNKIGSRYRVRIDHSTNAIISLHVRSHFIPLDQNEEISIYGTLYPNHNEVLHPVPSFSQIPCLVRPSEQNW